MAIATYDVGIFVEQPAVRRMNGQRRILTILFVISFALDFKGQVGGALIQFLMAGLNIATFLLLALSYRFTVPRHGLGAFVFWGWAAFLLTGAVGALVNTVPFAHFIRIAYPFILFLEGFLVASWVARDPHGAKLIVSVMLAAAIVSLVFTLGWGFYFTGEGAGTIRYQILSPLIPLLIVVAGYDLFFARRRRLWALFLLTITLGIIALSVTRGMLLMVGFVAGVVLLATFWNALHTAKLPRPLIWASVFAVMMVGVALSAAMLFYPEVIMRWGHRGFGAARDVAFWTRVAAIVGQFQALTAHPVSWLTGQGFGNSYPWPISDFPWILKYLGPHAGRSVWFPGEFMWMTFFFYSGFIVGSIAALVLLAGAVRSFRLLGALLRTQSWRNSQVRPLWIGVLGYFAFIGMGFTSDPLGSRLAAMFMGLCLGLVLTQGKIFMLGDRDCIALSRLSEKLPTRE